MKVAFPTLNGKTITSHFGHTKGFVVAIIDDGVEIGREFRELSPDGRDDPEHHGRHHNLVDAIADCDIVIAGGMGHPVQARLEAADINVVLTAIRPIDDAVAAYIDGSLDHDPERAHAPDGGRHHH